MSKIQVVELSKNFKQTQALSNINLTLDENKIYGLLGRNGAGKSTLLNIISNRIFASSGQVILDEKDVALNNNQMTDIYVVGENNLFPEGSKVKEIIKWTKEFFIDFDTVKANELCKIFNLPINKKVSSLSTGYLTILKDIIGLCVNSKFVFFDEPVLGLDANHRDMFYKQLIQCYSNNDSTFIVSTHLIDEVANIIENVIIIDEGKIIKDTSCEELLSMGYTISGKADEVDSFTRGMNIIGQDVLGNMKAVYVLSDKKLEDIPDTIEISKINLQKLFIEMTKKEAAQ